VLLGYATINVIAQLLARDTLATIATQFFITQGIGDYTPTALTASLGDTLNVITLALFVTTVLVTTWMLRRGRVAFWVPIAGGVVAIIVALVFVVVLLQSDPAFVAYLDGTRR
jgi:phosphotransferase system  glucose/maltose/N-acetylglucosamine-specific IIC component